MLKTIYAGTVSGIRVYIHWTFWLLVLYLFLTELGKGISVASWSVFFALSVFFCVFLHELGHAFAARWFGVPTRDITLLPIGGLARLEGAPPTPWSEFIVAICGPLVNAVIALAIFGTWTTQYSVGNSIQLDQMGIIDQLLVANIALFLFNLLPVYPMDGGRILRALLQFVVDKERAVYWTARLGQILAALLGLYGLFTFQLVLAIIFGIMFLTCSTELLQAKIRASMKQSGQAPSGGPFGFEQMPKDSEVIDAESFRRVQ